MKSGRDCRVVLNWRLADQYQKVLQKRERRTVSGNRMMIALNFVPSKIPLRSSLDSRYAFGPVRLFPHPMKFWTCRAELAAHRCMP